MSSEGKPDTVDDCGSPNLLVLLDALADNRVFCKGPR